MPGGSIGVTNHVHVRDQMGRFAAAIDKGAQEALIDVSKQGAATARVLAPKRTGHMAGTVQPFVAGGGAGGWRVATPYAMAQEKGASPHPIGSEGQVLANEGADFGPVKGPVMHPGNPATHFMQKSYNIMRGRILGIVKRYMP